MGHKQDNSAEYLDQVHNEARAWFIKNNYGGEAPSQTETFSEWLVSNQNHQDIYDDVCAFMKDTEAYTSDPSSQERYQSLLSEEATDDEDPFNNVVDFEPAPNHKRTDFNTSLSQKRFVFGAIAALLFIILGMSVTYLAFWQGETYQTAIGEQKTIKLADGSKVKLNTNSKITVDFTPQTRSITLDHGQAYFIVVKNKKQPFIVDFPLGEVTALGTEFEVYNKGENVVISLVEGSVKVHNTPHKPDDITLVANHAIGEGAQVTLSPQGASPVLKIDNELVNAWHKEQLIFRQARLGHVISEINRYSSHKIIVEDHTLSDEIISGVFPTQRDEALEIIKNYLNLTTALNDKEQIILERTH